MLDRPIKNFTSVLIALALVFSASSCTPSYPKDKLPAAVKMVCEQEYGMNVDVTVLGSTLCIYYPMEGLLDAGLGISEEAWDKIGSLLLIASRVVLSTDADIKFYCVITQDTRLPELQVVIIKYVDDVKRGMYRYISRGEAYKRTLFSINLTPQAKKERSIEKIFSKMGVKEETRRTVIDEFFRSPPTKLSDIGYWREKFYLKDITLQEFLASQIANRMKVDFRQEKDLKDSFKYETAEGSFISRDGEEAFLVKFKIADQTGEEDTKKLREKKINSILEIVKTVVTGYKFEDFDKLILMDQLANAKLTVAEPDVYNFNSKKTVLKDIVEAPADYF